MRWVFTVLFVWMAVHGVHDAASYTKYLMTAPIEDILEKNRPRRPGEKTEVAAGASTVYQIAIWGPVNTTEGVEPVVEVKLKQDRDLIIREKRAVSDLSPIHFDDGIHMFSETPDGGWAFLYLEKSPRIQLRSSDFAYLPEVPGKTVTAPIVISDGRVDILESYIHHNYHSTKAGGVYVTGGANVKVNEGQISHNKAEVGAVIADGTSVIELEAVHVFENEGSTTGGVYTFEQAAFTGRKVRFENQTTGSFATGVFSSGQSNATLEECKFEGRLISEDYKSCLLDPAVTDVHSCANSGDITSSVLHANDAAKLTIVSSLFTQHSTEQGTVLTSGLSELSVRDTRFIGNVAHTGAGVFIKSGPGATATLLDCDFEGNVARFGGAMVLAGNGNFTIDKCRFTQNQAILGGAIWGNKTQNHASTTEGGEKASSVARVTVMLSDFANNTAISHGGALSVSWSDIRSTLSTFYNNTAGGSGGAIYADDAYNLHFIDNQFDLNSANTSGGAVFASDTNDITAINTTFTNHSALENGGAIASVDGAGIILLNTTASNGLAYGSGGGIYTDNVESIDLSKSELVENTAGESGGALSLGKSSNLELDEVVLSPNVAYGKGGAIHASEGKRAIINNIDISAVNSSSSVISLASMGTVQLSGFNFEGYKDKKRCGGLEVDGASSLTITGMKFVGNEVREHGGALCLSRIDSGDFSNLEFEDNEAGISGGAIYMTNSSSLSFRDIYFDENSAGHQGGAIYAENGNNLEFHNSQFDSSSANASGGAVFAVNANTITAINTTFMSHSAFENGGTIASVDGAGIILRNSTVRDGHADGSGGGIYADNVTTVECYQSEIVGNEAGESGGALFLGNSSSLELDAVDLSSNIAYGSGGAIHAQGKKNALIKNVDISDANSSSAVINLAFTGSVQLSGFNFEGYKDKTRCGALAIDGASTLAINGIKFIGNEVEQDGGALCLTRINAGELLDVEFEDNVAGVNGGAIYVSKSSMVNFRNVRIDKSSAGYQGGAIYAENGNNLAFHDSQFDSNSANASGGAVFAVNANTITAINTTFTNHSALVNGGTIASVDGAGIVLRNSTISDGHVNGSGGGIYADNVTTVECYQSEIVGNEAGESGGALFLGKCSSLELDEVVLSPNVAYGSGGAIHAAEGKNAIIKNIDISEANSSSAVISLTSMGTVQLLGFNFEGYRNKTRCGGLEIDGASSLAMTGMKFIGNEVERDGGALCLTRISSGELSYLEFSDNKAGISGGAIHIVNSEALSFKDIRFNRNSATYQGGAIRGVNVSSLNLFGDVFSLNTATSNGGAVYLERSSINIQSSNFTYNYAGTNFTAFKNRTPVANSPQSQSASGIVHVRDGSTFQSHGSFYVYNEANASGGVLALVGMQTALIQHDHYLNGSASKSGGCILASGVLNLSIWDTTLKYCESSSGGALMVEGHSNVEGGYLFIEDNKAHNGGAFLCLGDSVMNIEEANFSFNSAEEGSTASVDCRCDMNFRSSVFYRDKDLPNNGDFFHVVEGCGEINSEGCEFYGGEDHEEKEHKEKDSGRSIPWLWIIICAVSLIGIILILLILLRRKKHDKKMKEDLEAGTKASLLIHGKGHKKGRHQTTLSTSDSEVYSTSETESSEDYSSSEESEEDSTEESESDESDHKPRRAAKKTTKNPVKDVILLEGPTPIEKKTHDQQKTVARHRKASKDKVNDGAGPSSYHTSVMPPDLEPVTSESEEKED